MYDNVCSQAMLRLPCSMRDCLLITVLALLLLVYIVTPNAKLTPNAEQRQQISALHNKLRTRTVPIPPPTAAAAKFDAPIAKESIPAEAAQSMAERYQRMKAAQQQAAVAAAAAGARKASAASIVSPHIAGGVGGGGAIAGGNVRLPPHAAAVAAVAAAAAASLGAGPVRLLSRDVPARASTPGNLVLCTLPHEHRRTALQF